jgi:hypothetical protein
LASPAGFEPASAPRKGDDIFVLYVIAFIDRINIGFAALTMNKELAITSQ